MLEYYLEQLEEYEQVDKDQFRNYYYGYVLIRILQAFGAYGYRGFFERKEHFLLSIPFAIKNIQWLFEKIELPIKIPELSRAIKNIIKSNYLKEVADVKNRLAVRVQSFSYKRDIPVDDTGHGGGFVFDCRGLPNPGRYTQYAKLTGSDAEVIDYLKEQSSVNEYLEHIFSILDITVKTYIDRRFSNLLVTFGCTGGQHRSVYCANQVSKYLKNKYDIKVELRHREQELKS